MTWKWQRSHWPNFTYDAKALELLEQQFLRQAGEFVGAYKHVGVEDQETLKIDLISEEAVKTSEIEGEILNRESVQSSLRAQLGLGVEAPNVKQAERGISKMMLDLYRNYVDPLSDQTMFEWHKMLLGGHKGIKVIGRLPHPRRCHAGGLRPHSRAHGPFRGAAIGARARGDETLRRLVQ
jgi:Fic family protein